MANDRFQNRYRIPTARANWHDYLGGAYYVTLCTLQRRHYFGEIANGEMVLSQVGLHALQCITCIKQHFPHADVPLWVVMPNHIHMVIFLDNKDNTTSIRNSYGPQSKNLASIIRGLKIGVTKYARENSLPFAWQPRYHDHIIRNLDDLNNTAEYIENNVAQWELDHLYG